MKTKSIKTMDKFIPYRRIINEDCIALKNEYTDFFRINDSQAREGTLEEKRAAINDFHQFLQSVTSDVKLVFSSFPLDLNPNIEYAKMRFSLNKNVHKNIKNEQEATLKILEHFNYREMVDFAYLQIFGEDEEDLENNRRMVMSARSTNFNLQKISMEQKVKLIYRFYNPLAPVRTGRSYIYSDETGRKPEIQKIVDKKGYDPAFLSHIQPISNLKPLDSKTLQSGEGYFRVLNLTTYRPKRNRAFWGENVFKFRNVMTSIDIHSVDASDFIVERKLNTSLGEYQDRVLTAKDRLLRKKAQKEYQALDNTIEKVLDAEESLKQIHVRYVLCEKSLEELDQKEMDIRDTLKKYQFIPSVYLDEQEKQFQSFFISYGKGNELISRKGKDIRSSSFAGSYAFNFSNHVDETAPYTGFPLYGSGLIFLSTQVKDKVRKSYGSVIIGAQGFGKSTLGKVRMENNVLYNNNQYGFFVSDEAERLTKYLGGMAINAIDPKINPCQINPTSVDNKTLETKEKESFEESLNTMLRVFRMGAGLDVKKDAGTLREAAKLFRNGYLKYMEENSWSMESVTKYDPEQYMRYQDFLDIVQNERKNEIEEFRKKDLYELGENLEKVISLQGGMFNQFSAFTLQDKSFVTFNLQDLMKADDTNVYNAQYYNLYNMVFAESLKTGQHEKYLFDRREKRAEELIFTDITHDEFHNPISKKNLSLIQRCDKDNREGRKIMIGGTYISQELGDLFPEFSNTGRLDDEISKSVMNIFKLSPYRFVFRQDASSKSLFQKVFDQQLSEGDLFDIFSQFEEGECLLNIRGVKNIKFKVDLRNSQKAIFDGGL
ncbi:trse protein [Enterococcus faecium]|uniref:trse protein n=1 Tax=Enterococcus faecium TaxID=1352 RepID=UPI0023B26587|nr:trse protein [Enterococcus faecium]